MKHEVRLSSWKQLSNLPVIDKVTAACSRYLSKFDQAIDGWVENIQSLSYSASEEHLLSLINDQEQTILKTLKTIDKLYITPSCSTHTKFYKSRSVRNKSYSSSLAKFKIFEVSSTSVSNFQAPKTISKKTMKAKPVYQPKKSEFYDDKVMAYLNRKNNKEYDEKIEEFKEEINYKINSIVEMLKDKEEKKENLPPPNELPPKDQPVPVNQELGRKNEQKNSILKKQEPSVPLTQKSEKKSTMLRKQAKIGKKVQKIKENEVQEMQVQQITHEKIKEKAVQLQRKQEMFKEFILMNDKVQIPANKTLNHIFDKCYKEQCLASHLQYKSLTDNKVLEVGNPHQQLKKCLQMLGKLLKSKMEEKKKKKVEKYADRCLSCTEVLVLKRERGESGLTQRLESIIGQL